MYVAYESITLSEFHEKNGSFTIWLPGTNLKCEDDRVQTVMDS